MAETTIFTKSCDLCGEGILEGYKCYHVTKVIPWSRSTYTGSQGQPEVDLCETCGEGLQLPTLLDTVRAAVEERKKGLKEGLKEV